MNILEALSGSGGLQQMARELGVDQTAVEAGASALLPAILGGFKNLAQSEGGLSGLLALVQQAGGAGLLDKVLSPDPTPVAEGQSVIGRIFGSEEVTQSITKTAAARTGLGADVLAKMLPMLAMAAVGFMAKQAAAQPAGAASSGQGGIAGLVGQIVGAVTGRRDSPAAGAGGLAGIAAMIDLDGDGNPLNDILRLAGGGRR